MFFSKKKALVSGLFFSLPTFFASLFLTDILAVSTDLLAENRVLSIQDGGAIQGKVLESADDSVLLSSASGTKVSDAIVLNCPNGIELAVPKKLIRKSEVRSDETVKYLDSQPMLKDTVDVHEKLAKWCREKGLTGFADRHFQRILELDPENVEAHKYFGHVQLDGEWVSEKEKLERQGYIRYQNRTMTRQEYELAQKKQNVAKEAAAWKKEVGNLVRRVSRGDLSVRGDLARLKSPYALAPIYDAYDREKNPERRVWYVQAMGSIGTPAAYVNLAGIAMKDGSSDVRIVALEQMKQSPAAIASSSNYFQSFLLDSDNKMINRAGTALGYLNVKDSIPALIEVLITTHISYVDASQQNEYNIGMGSQGGGGLSMGKAPPKKVTNTVQNKNVLNALRQIVGENFRPSVDFGFDVGRWKQWYRVQKNNAALTNLRRN